MTSSTRLVRQIIGGRIYPLTLEVLDAAMREVGSEAYMCLLLFFRETV